MNERTKLISEIPKIKIKGFKKENIKIVPLAKENKQIKHKIDQMFSTRSYNELTENDKLLISKIVNGYQNSIIGKKLERDQYILSGHELVEFDKIEDWNIFRYLIYRYKYNMYPILKKIDAFPPCVQIEPVSLCNFKCVFCYQVDKSFSNKKSGHMGHMDFDLFKKVVDELEGNVEAITLASRGEPTLHKRFGEMLDYLKGKFLAVKINSNASLLTDDLIHKILSSRIQTISFSIDAADKEMYEKLRVNGKFEKTLKNINRFKEIKELKYPNSKLIIRISGVKVNKTQNIKDMTNLWSSYADIVAYTNYTPWHSSYENKTNDILAPCTDLWRRLFVWWDGKVNPCDYDYKSVLSRWNTNNLKIEGIWNSNYYNSLRQKHLIQKRKEIEPCARCIST